MAATLALISPDGSRPDTAAPAPGVPSGGATMAAVPLGERSRDGDVLSCADAAGAVVGAVGASDGVGAVGASTAWGALDAVDVAGGDVGGGGTAGEGAMHPASAASTRSATAALTA